jgi:predicted  nucleic acid-binding Zn-ribbon protein
MVENPFYAFVYLVELDQSIDRLHTQYAKLTKQIAHAQQRLQQQEDLLKLSRGALQELRKTISHLELEHKALQAQEQQKRRKLEAVNTAKEYTALEHELQIIVQQGQEKEEAIVQREESALIPIRATIAEEICTIQDAQQDSMQEVEKLNTQRSQYVQSAPEDFVTRYESMRQSLKNPVVPVIENTCSACATHIVAGDLLQLRRHVIVPCKSCYRLLYMK